MFFSFIYQPFIDHQTTTLLVLSADPLLSRPFSHSSVVALNRSKNYDDLLAFSNHKEGSLAGGVSFSLIGYKSS